MFEWMCVCESGGGKEFANDVYNVVCYVTTNQLSIRLYPPYFYSITSILPGD